MKKLLTTQQEDEESLKAALEYWEKQLMERIQPFLKGTTKPKISHIAKYMGLPQNATQRIFEGKITQLRLWRLLVFLRQNGFDINEVFDKQTISDTVLDEISNLNEGED
ncbi:hypothetical protein [Siphonobacter sp. SORGH_AS_1065]|uniref:hypothetical protein n=1 Tax=Siphonobacter sp. SORGH_AS_1065 TaxID=3041795 RepID=UPI0027875BC7|nr:hypothetical protein [Siphonobacter sp. SORGH_AS_1065]MDQ1090450.1 putative XRE-type DNA-binding protein [Siphonobacter sp. SORGH_AS_1065]